MMPFFQDSELKTSLRDSHNQLTYKKEYGTFHAGPVHEVPENNQRINKMSHKLNRDNNVMKYQHFYITLRFAPSNGREPLTSVYRITPKLHTSTSGPSYFLPANCTNIRSN